MTTFLHWIKNHLVSEIFCTSVLTGKKTAIRRKAVRETGVYRHIGGQIKVPIIPLDTVVL